MASVQDRAYVLGHEQDELDRLMQQSLIYGDISQHLLQLAGLQPGMRVLDIGCGPGDMSFLAARLVGPNGSVVGVDRSDHAIALAARRAQQASVDNVHFVVHDLAALTLTDLDDDAGRFDCVIGRLVLMYFQDPAALIRRLLPLVRPGGIITFQEIHCGAASSTPECPLFTTTIGRVAETFRRAGNDPSFGLQLRRVFREAGLSTVQMHLEGRVEGGADAWVYEQYAHVARTLLPLMQRTGVATADEVGVDTLAQRLRDESLRFDAVHTSPPLIGAWARRGG